MAQLEELVPEVSRFVRVMVGRSWSLWGIKNVFLGGRVDIKVDLMCRSCGQPSEGSGSVGRYLCVFIFPAFIIA